MSGDLQAQAYIAGKKDERERIRRMLLEPSAAQLASAARALRQLEQGDQELQPFTDLRPTQTRLWRVKVSTVLRAFAEEIER